MTLIDGRFRIDGTILGWERDGLFHATDSEGRGYLVSMLDHHPPRFDDVLGNRRFDAPGCARLVFAKPDVDGLDIVVEEEPSGRASRFAPPLPPSAARSAALGLARWVNSGLGIDAGLPPELVYLDGEQLAGVAPRFFALRRSRNMTRAGGYSWFSPYMTSGATSNREDDAYAIGMLLRFWLTGAPPFTLAFESPMQFMVAVFKHEFLFRYEGPLRDAIDACVAGDLSRATNLLVSAKVDRAAEAMRARLIGEVVAQPGDDGPRLVLADWLLEREDPRGELIQLQCRHAIAPSPALAARADQLIAEHGVRWSAYLLPEARDPVFERGFVARVATDNPEALHQRSDALRAHGPLPVIV